MKQRCSLENPFKYTVKGFVWEYLKLLQPKKHLDYGCHTADMISDLVAKGYLLQAYGVDLNREAILKGQKQASHNVTLQAIEKGKPLPFEDHSFDSISIIGVLEHIADQKSILAELRRILKPQGRLIVCVPGKYIFSCLDIGNFKFRFPKLHKWVYSIMHSPEQYQDRYVQCKNGLFGDIEVEKMWHQHFLRKDISELLSQENFTVLQYDGAGFFNRILLLINLLMPSPLKLFWKYLINLDYKFFNKMELICIAKKS